MPSNPTKLVMKSVDKLELALSELESTPNKWSVFAGGTDLMVQIQMNDNQNSHFLDISKISELKNIEINENEIVIGSLVSYTQIQKSGILQAEFPNLCEAAKETGSIAIQNKGTIGGNIANASPAADTPPALLSYETKIVLVSKNQKRVLDYRKFHTDYKVMDIQTNEIIHSIVIKRNPKTTNHFYRKVGTRKAQAISKTVISATAQISAGKIENIKIAFGSVAPVSKHCTKIETFLTGKSLSSDLILKAKELLDSEISPIDDIRSNSQYRSIVSKNILGQFLETL